MIVIIGGTGSLGSATARRLLASDRAVRIMTRHPERAADLKRQGAEVVPGDLRDRSSLARACRGAEKVLAAAHAILGRGRAASKYVDLQGHLDLIGAAREAGVRHFVYTSVYNLGPAFETVPFLRFKRRVEQALKASGLDYTILRPTFFMESHAELFIGQPIRDTGRVALFGRGENPRNFVAADDVARIAVQALEDAALAGETIDIGGPDNLTNMAVVRTYERLLGRPARVIHVPRPVLRVMYPLLRPLHPGLSQIMQFSLYSDTLDSAFDPAPMLARFPAPLTRLEDWIAARLAAAPGAASLAAT